MSEIKELSWNVISEEKFKKNVTDVFNMVASSLTKTLGPYGSTTIIEKYGEMHITKDGWQVLKNIRFNDIVSNNILMLLLRISAQVVIKVGDGSTSSIVAANSILNELNVNKQFVNSMRPKDFMELLTSCVNDIVDYIYHSSHKVDRTTYDEIYKLAYIATNGDENISNMIRDIYLATNNPTIEYIKSKTDKTHYELVDGYRGDITYLDNIFATNDDGNCVLNNPLVIMFDHKIDIDRALPIVGFAANKAATENRRLVVIAPHYDQFLLEYIRKNISMEFKARGTSTVVYTRASLVNNMSHIMYNDFAIMCGSQVISEQFIEEITEDNFSDYIGTVDTMIIGDKTTFISGFVSRNENMYKKIIEDANTNYDKILADNTNVGIVDMKLNEAKQRVTKLRCNMGIISVGGNSTLEKNANYDLVEDAIKACESAYTHGYNIGGSLIIPYTINTLISNTTMDENKLAMYSILSDAFTEVFRIVLGNKYDRKLERNDEKIETIIANCLDGNKLQCYDLTKEQYSTEIINSCETDIEILKAAASIISLLTSSNQYITVASVSEQ